MMATSDNGTDTSNDIDIDALIMPDVNESEVSAVVDSLHQELTASSTTTPTNEGADNQPLTQPSNKPIDLTKTIKTEGEASNVTKPSTQAQLILNLSSTSTATDTNRRQSLSLMSPFGGIVPQTPLTPNSQLVTPEEQAAIHKQAGLLAIHTYCAKHGAAKAKEILDGVTKVKNFLTNLIQLASKNGAQVHSSVHTLVQKLVGATITEDEFSLKIEEVLKSKHQPNLLPFLKTSIPDLRQHILLQKGIMKQLIEKKVQEKKSQEGGVTQQQPPAATTTVTPTTSTSSHPVTPSTHQTTLPVHQSIPQHTPIQSTPPPSQHLDIKSSTTAHSTVTPTPLPVPATSSLSLTAQQQQVLKEHLSKLPVAQQKAYLDRIKKEFEKHKLQLMLQQKQLLGQQQRNTTGSNSLSITTPTTVTSQQLSILLKQQELIRQQQQQVSLSLGSASNQTVPHSKKSLSTALQQTRKQPLSSLVAKKTDKDDGPSPAKTSKTHDNEDDEDDGMDIAGVNLKEESAHFLPTVPDTVGRSVTDQTFVDKASLRERVIMTARLHGINDVTDDSVTLMSHALEERLRNIMDKLTVINQHRAGNLKDSNHYQVISDVRGQLKVLGKIDQISASRREEKEKEMIFKAAKSRSKQDDPELAKKKEQAKQIQLAQEREIHQKAANETALAAIGRRKRTATTAFGDTSSSAGTSSTTPDNEQVLVNTSSSSSLSSFFNSPGPSSRTKQKRKIQAKDVLFVMEQEKETKKSLLLYKSLLN